MDFTKLGRIGLMALCGMYLLAHTSAARADDEIGTVLTSAASETTAPDEASDGSDQSVSTDEASDGASDGDYTDGAEPQVADEDGYVPQQPVIGGPDSLPVYFTIGPEFGNDLVLPPAVTARQTAPVAHTEGGEGNTVCFQPRRVGSRMICN